MTVEQLIEKLREFPPYREVKNANGNKVTWVGEGSPEQLGPYIIVR